jgi:hypothetical protein
LLFLHFTAPQNNQVLTKILRESRIERKALYKVDRITQGEGA